ncbi:MAG: hypothetical protein GXO86_05585 [Chlorobi bacterium]|nr:hypothetical protein [Chlorobiota bacterium]
MKKIKEILLKSFDAELTPQERKLLDEALQNSEELRKEKRELEQMRGMFAGQEASFDTGFADRVMEHLEAETVNPPKTVEMYSVFKRVAFVGIAAIIALLITIYYIDGTLTLDAVLGISGYSPDGAELSVINLQDYENIILP